MAEMRKVEGGLVPSVIPLTEAGGRFYAVPMGLSPLIFTARTDLFEKAGYSTFPDTWEKLLEASLKLNKPPFYAYGMALGTTPGYSDSTGDILMLMWSHGGKLLDKDSRPAANSPGTAAAFQFIKDMYAKHQIVPKGAVSWDNAGNNKAYQSQQVAYVYDGTSIYSYLLTSDTELAARTGLFVAPAGPAGRARHLYTDYYGVFKASPYPEVAKGFIRYLMEPKRYSEFLVATQGRYVPVYPRLQSDPFWTSKPQFAGLLAIGREGLPMSWEGRITPALGEVVSQSLLGKTAHEVLVNGVEPAAAAAKLQAEIVAIYRRMNEPV
jgi:multiple sugar transport system substrate-binding protein